MTDDLLSLITIVPLIPERGAAAKTYEHFIRCVKELNENGESFVTRYEKRDRSGYFIIFVFLVSIDSYACVRSNGAN